MGLDLDDALPVEVADQHDVLERRTVARRGDDRREIADLGSEQAAEATRWSPATSCASSGTSTRSNDGRLSTTMLPLRSRIVPRVARTRFRRMRLCSESERYSSPSLTCRCQRRTKVSPKSATTTREREPRAGGETRSGSRAGWSASVDAMSGDAGRPLGPPSAAEHERRERRGEQRLGEEGLRDAERHAIDREVGRERDDDRRRPSRGFRERPSPPPTTRCPSTAAATQDTPPGRRSSSQKHGARRGCPRSCRGDSRAGTPPCAPPMLCSWSPR